MAKYTKAERQLRSEYSRYSRRIREQLKRLNEKIPENMMNDYLRGEFPTLRELGNKISTKGLRNLRERAEAIYRSGGLTVRGYNESLDKSAATLREDGFEFVDASNVERMWRFIDDMRARGLADIYGYRYFIGMYNRIQTDKRITSEVVERSLDEWTQYAEKYTSSTRQGKRPKKLRFKMKGSSNEDLQR